MKWGDEMTLGIIEICVRNDSGNDLGDALVSAFGYNDS
jgi:hypothetical protein